MDISETEIRLKYLRGTLYQLMTSLLKFSTKSHPQCINKTNLNAGLAEIIQANKPKFKAKKCFHADTNKKKYFYNAGKLKNEIEIERLDMTVIFHLLKTSYLSRINRQKCCSSCSHPCTVCVSACQGKKDCQFNQCSKCMKTECPSKIFYHFMDVAIAIRHNLSHYEDEFYIKFEEGVEVFEDFPKCNTWSKLWEVINTASLKCLTVLRSKGALSAEEHKDFQMELQNPLKNKKEFLLDVLGMPGHSLG